MRGTVAIVLASTALSASAFTSYANDFIDPKIILSNGLSNLTIEAQETIVEWAEDLAAAGPWNVTSKPFTPPSGTKKDYMSFAPYWWPDCSSVGNTTALTQNEVWTTCPYVVRDGKFNPDAREVNDIGNFESMANAVFYNALAWATNGTTTYAESAARFINTWFLDADTGMNPNLNYSQMQRGPTGQKGTHTGILDLKCMAKVVSAVLLMREGKAAAWTTELDTGLNSWTTEYIGWLTSAGIALEEKAAPNNHGTFYYNQLAALQVLVGDNDGAKATVTDYFTTKYLDQIAANGDQPLETARTRPYHYRAYNLAAMITNAKIGDYVGYSAWNLTTHKGSTIQTALDYAMTLGPGTEVASELYPNIVAVGATYGDAKGTYANFMLTKAGDGYVADAQFLWNQPFSDSGLVKAPTSASLEPVRNIGGAGGVRPGLLGATVAGFGVVAVLVLGA
ncbi:chondroitin AC/alginate lyase [Epithele typhae]|uniref:chondroitin AC/alginate lyase n=1 Tax=Epithele typhae TaxID=378194 RepID=UPI00200857F6|nr:chondroitin AC/alginate lyase [Epithele typhae]KAH9929064.1 chondroitin AC/alginate lyase [Epithele typhae]